MFIQMLLLLPTVEPAKLVINEYSMKEVKVDDHLIDQILGNVFPEHKDEEPFKGNVVKLNQNHDHETKDEESDHSDAESPNGFMKPSFDTKGQTRFKKITNRVSKDKFSLRNRNLNIGSNVKMKTVDEDSTETDPLYFLSKLVIKMMEYLPPQFKVPVNVPRKKKKPKLSNKNVTEKVEKAAS